MTFTSDRPITVDGVRLDTLAWNVTAIQRQTAGRRSADVSVPGLDGSLPSLNDPLEPAQMGLEMFVRGREMDGSVASVGGGRKFQDNLDELVHLFGKRHGLLEVRTQPGDAYLTENLAKNPTQVSGGWSSIGGVSVAWKTDLGAPWPLTTGAELTSTAPYGQYGLGDPANLAAGQRVLIRFWAMVPSTSAGWAVQNLTNNESLAASWPGSTFRRLDTGEQVGAVVNDGVVRQYELDLKVRADRAGGRLLGLKSLNQTGAVCTVSAVQVHGDVSTSQVTPPWFSGASVASGDYRYEWTGTANASTSLRTPLTLRRAWAKVTDVIAPESLDAAGTVAKFTVGLTLPYGVWEDVVATDWAGVAGLASGAGQAMTSLYGGTEQIRDAVVLLQGPITAPIIRDRYGDTSVTLGRTLAAGEFWRLNCATWSSRVGTTLTLGSADTAGTDVSALTTTAGPVTGSPLVFYPVRRDPVAPGTGPVFPERRYAIRVDGGGITSATQVSVRARRKYAL